MKTIIITGASRGIGRAISLQLSKTYHVIALARSLPELEDLAKESSNISIYNVDITDYGALKNTVSNILELHKDIYGLINNAGVGVFKSLEDTSIEEMQQTFNVNVMGAFYLNKLLIPKLKEQKAGHIITIESDVSKRTFANGSSYCASKYAQEGMSASMRAELRPFNIKVSNLYPGMTDSYFAGSEQGEKHKEDWLKPEDIAQAVEYVLSTPQNVVIDELMIHPMCQEY
ncbi:SDR family oxidoreductase [Shewanella sp. 202IG2-18]|uniref:SDR family oxidoreductase n=1 Tax=Parashewanella hymeniacidonis TaxID=2807618 RepID=UPI00195FEC31|nr:SDR family oxidoreductase [Parashewanella hymeniacidonis]MBM7073121.1 SDR family oxidoreductase [Parashewanella hymeniacidonis]